MRALFVPYVHGGGAHTLNRASTKMPGIDMIGLKAARGMRACLGRVCVSVGHDDDDDDMPATRSAMINGLNIISISRATRRVAVFVEYFASRSFLCR